MTKMLGFEQIIELPAGNEVSKIGYIKGSSKVLFIKGGQGGELCGYDNRYLRLAHAMHTVYGCSVFVSETRVDTRESYEQDMRVVAECFGNAPYEIYYMGISKGGLIGCWYAPQNPHIRSVVAVNAPLMINFYQRTLPALKYLGRERVMMIFGSLDPSFPLVGFAARHANVRVIEGVDHQFRDHSEILWQAATEMLNESKTTCLISDNIGSSVEKH